MSEPDPPWLVAGEWLEAVLDRGDYTEAWAMCDPPYRRAVVQGVLTKHPRITAVIADRWSTSDSPSGALWNAFADEVVGVFRHRLGVYGRPGSWGVSTEPRVIGIGLELVVFFPTVPSGTLLPEGPSDLPHVPFLMRHTDAGWKVLNALSSEMPTSPAIA